MVSSPHKDTQLTSAAVKMPTLPLPRCAIAGKQFYKINDPHVVYFGYSRDLRIARIRHGRRFDQLWHQVPYCAV